MAHLHNEAHKTRGRVCKILTHITIVYEKQTYPQRDWQHRGGTRGLESLRLCWSQNYLRCSFHFLYPFPTHNTETWKTNSVIITTRLLNVNVFESETSNQIFN